MYRGWIHTNTWQENEIKNMIGRIKVLEIKGFENHNTGTYICILAHLTVNVRRRETIIVNLATRNIEKLVKSPIQLDLLFPFAF